MNISRFLNQKAVYYATPQNDGYGGMTYADPVEISVRWEDKQEVFTTTRGDQDVSRCVVYTDQDMDLDGKLFLGTLAQASIETAWRIKATSKIPDLKGVQFIRKCWL